MHPRAVGTGLGRCKHGIHPQLRVTAIDPATSQYRFFEKHSVSVAPFEVQGASPEKRGYRACAAVSVPIR